MGSSPRVRGSLCNFCNVLNYHGIIPAGAGLTSPKSNLSYAPWDHPRGCGAHCCGAPFFVHILGSSPRVRGSLLPMTLLLIDMGIIPAGAGLTILSKERNILNKDHPRGCGAHIVNMSCETMEQGIIPAGAGLTCHCKAKTITIGDHPRGCGAHICYVSIRTVHLGSSPRVRGSRNREAPNTYREGIIPAGAGLTEDFIERAASYGDHPRGCGAHASPVS